MPTTTNLTPAEIARLERDIAERVIGAECWKENGYIPITKKTSLMLGGSVVKMAGREFLWGDWSPWNNPADALEVLKQIVKQNPPEIPAVAAYKISCYASGFDVSLPWRGLWAHAPGPHFGPAVCRLAEKILNEKQTV